MDEQIKKENRIVMKVGGENRRKTNKIWKGEEVVIELEGKALICKLSQQPHSVSPPLVP